MSERTVLTCLTPPGSAAIATLALHGSRAWDVLARLYQPLGRQSASAFLEQLQRGARTTFHLGKIGDAQRGGHDDVVLLCKEHSPEPLFEIHCHGGRQVLLLLQEAFAAEGVVLVPWSELYRLRGRSASEVLLTRWLTEAATLRTAAILLDQYHGALTQALQAIASALSQHRPDEALQGLTALLRYGDVGRHLTQPWRVVLAGAPNVGKSSILNLLAGYQRAVVMATPGTTRDVVSATLAIDGWLIELRDTAGQRSGDDTLEQQGIALARAEAERADLCLWIVAADAEPVWPTAPLPQLRVLVNKSDLPAVWDVMQCPDALAISALTGAGREELCQRLAQWLVAEAPPPGVAVPCSGWMVERLEAALACCQVGRLNEASRLVLRIWDEHPWS